MGTFSYQIAARQPRKINQTLYDGKVQAENAGDAIKRALADTFGDPDLSDPVMSLADWHGDYDELEEQFGEIESDDEDFELANNDCVFVVEVTEVVEPWSKTGIHNPV